MWLLAVALACGERLLVAAVWGAWTGFSRSARPTFLLVRVPAACGCVLVARRVVAIFVGEGRLAWVFLSCFCSRIRVRARACLFVLCGV